MARQPIVQASQSGFSSEPLHGFEGATQSFKAGAVLVYDTGQLDEGGANPTAIAGVSVHGAAATQAANCPYIPALPGVIFEGTLDDGNDLGTGAWAAADAGLEYGLTKDANGIWYVDKNKTGANGRVRILAPGSNVIVGTVQPRVLFTFTSDIALYAAS